jgi:hypothetical protein
MKIRMTIALLLVLSVGRLSAQDNPSASKVAKQDAQGESRIEVGLAFAQTLGSATFSATQTLRDYAEDGRFNSSYDVAGAPGAGFDLQYNLTRNFGLRIGAQTFSRKSTAAFEAQIPHPFFFSQPRTISGSQSSLGFNEAAYSLTGVYRARSGKWNLNIEGGPAYFSVRATVAEKVTYTDVYPYDTAAFGGITSSKHKISPFGFAVGLEVGRQLTPSASVVAQGRFSQASGDLDVSGQKVGIKAGGAQARLGVRFVLARKRVSR